MAACPVGAHDCSQAVAFLLPQSLADDQQDFARHLVANGVVVDRILASTGLHFDLPRATNPMRNDASGITVVGSDTTVHPSILTDRFSGGLSDRVIPVD